MYIGIGACVLGMFFLLRASLTTTTTTTTSVGQGNTNELLTGATPVKIGKEIVEKSEEDEVIFRIVTSELGEQYNPIFASTAGEKVVAELLFEPLAQRNVEGIYENVLAKEIIYDDVTGLLTVTIKDDIVFANGVPLMSSHVRDSLLFAILTSNPATNYIVGAAEFQKDSSTSASGIKIIDDKTLTIQFSRYELQNMEILETPIQMVPALSWGEEDFLEYARELMSYGIGTNAFVLDSRNDYQVRLVQNVNYRHPIETIEIVDVFDSSVVDIRTDIYEGTIDYIDVAYGSMAVDIILADEKYDVYGKTQAQTVGLYINPDSVMGGNPTVRAVLKNAIDRSSLSPSIMPVTSILSDSVLPNKELESMMNLELVKAHMMALYNDINLQMLESEMAEEVVEELPQVVEEIPQEVPQEVEEIPREVPQVVEEIPQEAPQEFEVETQAPFSDNFELLPYIPEEEVKKDRVTLTEDGSLLISIMVMDGSELYLEIAEELQAQLESVGFVVQLKLVDQNEYIQALYMTGDYDFSVGEMQAITEISDLDMLVEEYGIDVDEDIFWLMNHIVTSESVELQLQAVERLHNILENKFLFIPLGRAYHYTAVSTYWQNYVVTPTTVTPQKLYQVVKHSSAEN